MENHEYFINTGSMLFKSEQEIFLNKVEPQEYSPPHYHDFIEIIYVAGGKGIHFFEDEEYMVSKGDIMIINYNIRHGYKPLSEPQADPFTVYNCIFKSQFIAPDLKDCKDIQVIAHHYLFDAIFPADDVNRSNIRLIGMDSWEIEELIKKMYREYLLKDKGYIEILRAYLIELMVLIYNAHYKKNVEWEKIDTPKKLAIEK